ncbi:MAG: Coenzyme biosynthesis-associated protein [Frankiales bacterium]|nr:Coenzyme biosynthesis-associated protein [Frankiales bacterium]
MGRMGIVDINLAAAIAGRLAPAGPQLEIGEAADVVVMLRDLTAEAEQHVRDVTGLHGVIGPATVVDRPGWARANAEGFDVVLAPLEDTLLAKQGKAAAAVTSKVTAVQMGALLSWLSSKVLGQYEAFQPEGRAGRLLLVAPNIVETERRLEVDPRDFRLWVAIHEVTHRTQFTAVDWLHEHVRSEINALLTASGLDRPDAMLQRLKQVAGNPRSVGSIAELLQTPEQRVVMDRVTAFMSLLEGHAEHVMDGVGPSVVPSVVQIRGRFEERRRDKGNPLERVLRRLLGLDMKALQYAEGSRFVGHVVDAVGMTGFNRVWESPATLPTRAEITAPQDWVARIHGASSASA